MYVTYSWHLHHTTFESLLGILKSILKTFSHPSGSQRNNFVECLYVSNSLKWCVILED